MSASPAVAVVGLTGGIGSGKSTVARMLAERGAAIIDADVLAREAVAPGSAGLEAVVARFGEQVLTPEGALDRPALGAIVFADTEARRALEAIVHPQVAALAMAAIAAHREAGAPLIVYDVPLLFENGLEAMFEAVLVVSVPPETQLARVQSRDGLSEAAAQARVDAQMPLAQKVARATHVIDNSGTIEQTRARVEALWAELVSAAPGAGVQGDRREQ